MEKNEELDEQINRYIHNMMDMQALAQFESRLASDPALKKEVEQWKQLRNYYNKDLVDLAKNLQEAGLRYREKNRPTDERTASGLGKRKFIWTALAGIAVMLAIIFYVSRNSLDIVQLAKENSLDGLNKASGRKRDSIAVVDVLFYAGNYSGYIDKAISLLHENPNSIERSILNINICKSYIQLNQADKAVSFYQSLSKEEKEYCYLQYQAALAYTISNNKKEAVQLFESVVNAGCFPVDKKATEWLKKLP